MAERKRFEFDPRTVSLEAAVFEALGAASTSWVGGTGSLEFDSRRAAEIGEALLERIQQQIPSRAIPAADFADEVRAERLAHPLHGYDAEHDDAADPGYLVSQALYRATHTGETSSPGAARQDLVLAASLLWAEADRIERGK